MEEPREQAVTIDTPLPTDLLDIIKATKTTGLKTWLVGKRGDAMTEQNFTDWFGEEVQKAGMPARCCSGATISGRCLSAGNWRSFCLTGKAGGALSSSLRKIFHFTEIRNCSITGSSCPMRGTRRASSEIVGQGAMDADSARDNRRCKTSPWQP